jgi:folylpolyglutamate synthase/dihydropteroate synthase
MIEVLRPGLSRIIATKAVHPRALEPQTILATAEELGIPAEMAVPVEAALRRALELSAKDGSIVLSAGSMFVTAEVKTEWEKYVKTLVH